MSLELFNWNDSFKLQYNSWNKKNLDVWIFLKIFSILLIFRRWYRKKVTFYAC